MVFESIVSNLLNKVLGDYVENLDTKQLKLGIWGGDVVLTDLVLKRSALSQLDLPVQAVYGRLAKLVLKIPWKNLYYSSVEATIDGLYVLVEPNSQIVYVAEKEEKKTMDAKAAHLARIEAARKRELEKDKKVDTTFVEKLTTQIVRNVQVKIKNIHIRYEDKVTNPEFPFAMGITLCNLVLQTTDDNWLPHVVYDDNITKIFKIIDLEGLAAYWNSNTELYGGNLSPETLVARLQEEIACKISQPESYDYILGPINSSARLKLNPKPERDESAFSIPKVVANWEMEKLSISISKDQYRDLVCVGDSMSLMMVGEPYRKYRPTVPIIGNAKEWWKFAYNCVLEFEVRRKRNNWNWVYMQAHRKLCKEYEQLYQTKCQAKKVTPELEESLRALEKHLDLMNIMLLRQKVTLDLERKGKLLQQQQQQQQKAQASKGWFSGWWSKQPSEDEKGADGAKDIVAQFQEAMTADEKRRLFEAIDYQEQMRVTQLPESYIDKLCTFILRTLEVKVYDGSNVILDAELSSVKCKLETRAAASALGVHVNIKEVQVIGVTQDDFEPMLVTSKISEQDDAFLDVLFETHPYQTRYGQRLYATVKPLKVIYDANTINSIVDVFTIPHSSSALAQLSETTAATINNVKTRSAAGLQYVIDKHVVIDVKIDLHAPFVVIPYGGMYTDIENVLVANLGHVKIESIDKKKVTIKEKLLTMKKEEVVSALIEESYDHFVFTFTELQVVLAPGGEDWFQLLQQAEPSDFHLLNPMSLHLDFFKSMIENDPRLPKIKMSCVLPSISFNITDLQIVLLLGLVNSIPFKKAKELPPPVLLARSVSHASSQLLKFYDFIDKDAQTAFEEASQVDVAETPQSTLLHANFVIKEFFVTLSHQEYSRGPISKVAVLKLAYLGCSAQLHTFVTEVDVNLSKITFHKLGNEKEIELIETPGAFDATEKLFDLSFKQVNKKCPEFSSIHGSCESKITLSIFTLRVTLHQEAIQDMMKYATELQVQIEEIMTAKRQVDRLSSKSSLTRKLSSITESYMNAAQKKKSKAVLHGAYIQTILFKLVARLNEIEVNIANNMAQICTFAIRDANVNVILKEPYTEIKANLKDISIIDLDPRTKHKQILKVLGDDALCLQLVLYNKDVDTSRSEDILVEASMGCIRLIFLNLFVSRLLDFLDKFQAARSAIIEASVAAADRAKQNVTNIYENAVQINMNIDLKAPEIIIPESSQCLDALMIDFGRLIIMNKFLELGVKNDRGQHAIIDDMELKLANVQLTRVKFDSAVSITSNTSILKPVTFTVLIKRNLSSGWYKAVPDMHMSGTIDSIELELAQPDYSMIMSTINGNLAESVPRDAEPTRAKTITPIESRPTFDTSLGAFQTTFVSTKSLTPEPEVHIFLKFNFVMNKFVIKLFTMNDLEDRFSFIQVQQGLAMFSLEGLSLKGRILSDNTINTSVLLVDCLLDDIRPGKQETLHRMFSRSCDVVDDNQSDPSGLSVVYKSMIDVTFKKKYNDIYLELRISGFNLILSMEFLSKIQQFFTSALVDKAPPKQHPEKQLKKVDTVKSMVSQASKSQSVRSAPVIEDDLENKLSINIRLEKPDIVLVESLVSTETNALIFNLEMLVKLRVHGDHQVINGVAKDIQMYTCCYNPSKRENSRKTVLFPFAVSIAGSTPAEEKGMNIEVVLSEIRIKVSPATIELLNRAYMTMFGIEATMSSDGDIAADYKTLWNKVQFQEPHYWFFKAEMAEDATDMKYLTQEIIPVAKKELCIVTLPRLILAVEIGEGKHTIPILLLESHFDGNVKNWSSDFKMEATLTLQIGYYNTTLAVWEPLIEPICTVSELDVSHRPWDLKIDVSINNDDGDNMDVTSPESAEPENIIPQPKMCIEVSSSNNMELTVTKTSLDVFNNLSNAFSQAVLQTELRGKFRRDDAPFRFINMSGLNVLIQCAKGSFRVYQNVDVPEVLLGNGAQVSLQLRKEDDERGFKLGDVLADYSKQKERFLDIKIIEPECAIRLNLVRSVSRYFSLKHRAESNDTWAVVTAAFVVDGCFIVTLSSIVKVYNHLNTPVDVYYMKPSGNELECIGTIASEKSLHVPIKAVYNPTSELFFSIPKYSVSTVPFIWKDLQLNVKQTQILQCLPKSDAGHGEPFIIKAVSSIQQIYNENTVKKTMNSTLCNVHLHPPVLFRNSLPVSIELTVQDQDEDVIILPGFTLPVTHVTPGLSNIVLRLPDYLEKEWSCVHEISPNPPQFSVWTFDSYDSTTKVSLDLGVHILENEGSQLMTIYCPFWMINKSELNIAYRSSDENLNLLHHPATFKGPILFSFNAKNFFGKKKASIKIESGGEWSDKFSIDAAGSSGVIICKHEDKIYQLGVSIVLTHNGLTKQVTFTPYYVLINSASFAIECQEHERPADGWTRVEPNSCTAMWPMADFDDKLLKLRVVGSEEVSAPFFITESHTTLLKLPNKYGGVNVDTQITEGAVYISFAKYEGGMAPALILNNTKNTLNIWEKDTVHLIKLDPGHRMYYTWLNPVGSRVLVWEGGYRKEIEDDLRKDGCGEYAIAENNYVYWVSFLDGMQRILLFTCSQSVAENAQSSQMFEQIDKEIILSIHGLGLSLVNNVFKKEIMYIGIASSGIIWETCKHGSKRYHQMNTKDSAAMEVAYNHYLTMKAGAEDLEDRMVIDAKTEVDFQLFEMFKPHARKIRRTFLTGLWLSMTTNPYLLQLHAKINRIQIDNQIYDCIFPVVLAPVPPPKSVAGTDVHKPFAELSIVQMLIKHSQIKQFKYFKLLIQEFHIKLELGFVTALSEMFELSHDTLEKERVIFLADADLVNQPLYQHVCRHSQQEQKSFYDLLHFSPLKIHVSFSLGSSGSSQGLLAPNFINVLLQGLGVTLTDMQDVVFRLAYFEREYTFLTQKQLISEASSHYTGQAVKQLYALVLGLDVLGNPYGLVLGITKGVEDLFYEPFQGAIQGPGEFAEGLALGVRSLFGHTVGGAAGAVSRITGAMGKGIAALTFDKEYQRKRRDLATKKANTVSEGIARSGKGLVMGVYDGITGVIRKPISGAKEQGVGGFFKGLGKGAVGLVTRPTSGVIDFASSSFDTVKRVTELSSEEARRLRPGRFIQFDGLIKPYNNKEATGNKILLELEKGKYATTDFYVFHYTIIFKKEILLFTDKRLLYVSYSELFGVWQVEWGYIWQDIIVPPKIVAKGVQITVSTEGKKKKTNIFSSADTGKTILVTDPKVVEAMCTKLTEVQKLYSC